MLSKARERISNSKSLSEEVTKKAEIINFDLTKQWQIEQDSTGLAFGNLVLEHVQDLTDFFKKVSKIIKSGGTLFVSEFHPYR